MHWVIIEMEPLRTTHFYLSTSKSYKRSHEKETLDEEYQITIITTDSWLISVLWLTISLHNAPILSIGKKWKDGNISTFCKINLYQKKCKGQKNVMTVLTLLTSSEEAEVSWTWNVSNNFFSWKSLWKLETSSYRMKTVTVFNWHEAIRTINWRFHNEAELMETSQIAK